MQNTTALIQEIRVKGKPVVVPSTRIGNQTIIVTGRWLRIASLLEEGCGEGSSDSPESLVEEVRKKQLDADIYTFAQQLPDVEPRYKYYFEWDNVAAIPITTFEEWIQKRVETDVRQNVRKSARRGVSVRRVELDDQLIRGIVDIYNETPVRQGRRFWHFGKDFEAVKTETSHAVEQSYFIGSYFNGELIGFIKLLRSGSIADIVLIVCKEKHRDKRPTNALIAKAVEVCVEEKIPFLTYAQFFYYRKPSSSLAEFKRRNGFEPISFPRYYVPLTKRGRLALKMNFHHGVKGAIPESVLELLRKLRERFYQGKGRPNTNG